MAGRPDQAECAPNGSVDHRRDRLDRRAGREPRGEPEPGESHVSASIWPPPRSSKAATSARWPGVWTRNSSSRVASRTAPGARLKQAPFARADGSTAWSRYRALRMSGRRDSGRASEGR